MRSGAPRVGFATAAPGGLALGDPTGVHMLLTATHVRCRRASEVLYEVGWGEVRVLDVVAPASRWRWPGTVAVLTATAVQGVGLDWAPDTAPVLVTVHDEHGRLDLECDGYIGPGYWHPHLVSVRAAAHALITHPTTRTALRDPAGTLLDLRDLAGPEEHQVRQHLTRRWRGTCPCPQE